MGSAPKVTIEDIEDSIVEEHYFTAADGIYGKVRPTESPLNRLTFCILVLRNGFTISGESACVSPENFDAQIGRDIARKKAIAKIWPLMGFTLADRLFQETA